MRRAVTFWGATVLGWVPIKGRSATVYGVPVVVHRTIPPASHTFSVSHARYGMRFPRLGNTESEALREARRVARSNGGKDWLNRARKKTAGAGRKPSRKPVVD